MPFILHSVLLAAVASASVAVAEVFKVTPHEQYSSSIGVLGCKIDTNRVAYFPTAVGCNNICIKVSREGRSLNLLRIDQSQGAHDISYDAWNFLMTGSSAKDKPTTGGGEDMTVDEVAPEQCASLIKTPGNKLPLSASNSMNYLTSCLAQASSFVAKNHVLINIQDPQCHFGHDEVCELPPPEVSNQAKCPSVLGTANGRLPDTVFNIQVGTGKSVAAA
ncbi:hypothetical protein B0T26DRAFT_742475 [Lasiosphaeria miniovina]|uniref:Cerato-platanin n=1 Tax=Lasiosphaeria miniovina TaxID=1954250 RepID=A0AA40ADY1_9PEZI|nr:uncharacterized protein B0T26DRAFT_742475 [Lasiosphaeria miniovina]KAK0714024.1 hypothetical protein B0T26DRAFT_742475 [Lasiosphaeria miniovina]